MSPRWASIVTRHFCIWRLARSSPAALGAHYFLAGRLHVIEEVIQHLSIIPIACRSRSGRSWCLSQYRTRALALWFVRLWSDRSLARHCHFIGLPLSVAACFWSGFEPLAAVICLSAYATLSAGRLDLRRPVADVPGRGGAGGCRLFRIDARARDHAGAIRRVAAALLGFVFWGARVELRRRQCRSLVSCALARAGLVLTGSGHDRRDLASGWVGVGSWTGAGAFAVVGVLAFLLNRERPRESGLTSRS